MEERTPPRVTDQRYLARYLDALQAPGTPAALWDDFSRQARLPTVPYAFQASAVYSSNIEGNPLDLNGFMRSKLRGQPHPKTREQAEIEALVEAYAFARRRVPNERNLLEAHRRLAQTILPASQRGSYRTGRMFVYDSRGIVYAAVEAEHVADGMRVFFAGVAALRRRPLSVDEVFYHAALLHLVFAHIHPFEDGNGRTARLLEKWFLATHLGERAWKVPSEEYYWLHRPAYYEALQMGPNYYLLDYDRCIPFLTLLPKALASALR